MATVIAVGLVAAPSADAATVTVPPEVKDCAIRNGSSANTNYCATTTLDVGGSGTTKRRSLISFPVSDYVPQNSQVSSATLSLHLSSRSTTNPIRVDVHELTREWTSVATWNRAKAWAPFSNGTWTTPGGDFKPGAAGSNPSVGGALGRVTWPVTSAVSDWVTGAKPNNGLILKQNVEGTPANLLAFGSSGASGANQPFLEVTYEELPPDESPAGVVFLAQQYEGGPEELWRADADGSNPKYIIDAQTPGGAMMHDPALSPDGTRVVVPYKNDIGVIPIAGGEIEPIYEGPSGNGESASHPQWSPDGERVIFVADVTAASTEGIRGNVYVSRADGSRTDELEIALPFGATRVRDPSFSSTGREIVFSATDDQAKNGRMYTVDSVGGNRQIVRSDPAGGAGGSTLRDTAFSPDGSAIAYGMAGDDYDLAVHTIGATGQNSLQLTNSTRDPGANDAPTWSPNGNRIAFTNHDYSGDGLSVKVMNADGTDASKLLPNIEHSWNPSFRQPADMRLVRADMFRPYLLFDSGEHWRPLEIDGFFAEGHATCVSEGVDCLPIDDPAELSRVPFTDAVLDVTGDGSESNYTSPFAECLGTVGLTLTYDCDHGPRSAIYWHRVTNSPAGYTYYDYWFFYRYNDVPDPFGDHESDWESVSIAPAPNDETFDFATFSSHGGFYSYLRDNLSCDLGGQGSCGTLEDGNSGRHLSTYVAAGSHANYPDACGGPCSQPGGSPFPNETDHDGQAPWGNQLSTESLLEFPMITEQPAPPGASGEDLEDAWVLGPQNWPDWPGDWGASSGVIRGPAGGDPNRAHFYAPWDNECIDFPICAAEGSALRGTSSQAAKCGSWFSSSVNVLACKSRPLRRAIDTQSMGEEGAFDLDVQGDVAASGPGIAQSLGEPLEPGNRAVLSGASLKGVEVSVHMEGRNGELYEALVPERRSGAVGGRLRFEVRHTDSSPKRGAAPALAVSVGDQMIDRIPGRRMPQDSGG